MTLATMMVAEARRLRGVRFRHQGRHHEYGLDCLGLLVVVGSRCGITLAGQSPHMIDRRDYSSRPDTVMLREQLGRWLRPVTQPQPGDVLLLDILGEPQHLALVSDYPHPAALGMIHAYAPARQVVEHRYDTAWQAATRCIFRLPQD